MNEYKKIKCPIWIAFSLSVRILILVLPVLGCAQVNEKPKSFTLQIQPLDQVDRKTLMKVNVDSLLTEDQKRGNNPKEASPLRFAVAEDVVFNLDNSGTWENLSDGRLWRLRIYSPGALSHNLGFTHFTVPEGVELWIYNTTRQHVEGPYTASDSSPGGSLWTPIIVGSEIVIELFMPAGALQPVVEIGKVNKGYRSL